MHETKGKSAMQLSVNPTFCSKCETSPKPLDTIIGMIQLNGIIY